MKDLIGKKFRRNVYGLSVWEDTVQDVYVQWKWIDPDVSIPKIRIKGTLHDFSIDEIVITNHKMFSHPNAQKLYEAIRLGKAEYHKQIMEKHSK